MNDPNNENGQNGGQPQQPQQAPQQPYQQPQQPNYQQAPQQPYYQQPPQQPYQQPQQPYYQQPPQQPYYPPQPQQPQQPVPPQPATEAEKNAYFKSVGSILMLIVCIVGTLSFVIDIVAPLLSFKIVSFIFGLVGGILGLLIVIGMWICWGCARSKKLNAGGLKLIRIPYIIQFVFCVIGFVVDLIVNVIIGGFAAVLGSSTGSGAVEGVTIGVCVFMLLQVLVPFIFDCIVFSSLNKTLKVAQTINNNYTVAGQKASKTLGIVLIIAAAIQLILGVVGLIVSPLTGIGGLLTGIFSAAYWIIGALILLGFAKNLNSAHGLN